MTVHQAKNQEFSHVIILWPYEIAGNDEKKRRLLYNAVTRARDRVLILVQGLNSKNMLEKAPFK